MKADKRNMIWLIKGHSHGIKCLFHQNILHSFLEIGKAGAKRAFLGKQLQRQGPSIVDHCHQPN